MTAPVGPRIPLAAYRLQLGPQLSFDDAAALVPYPAALGISDCYISPFFETSSESSHGYDVSKGYEDTALYRFNRLVSLNGVGADPSRFGTPLAEFHAAMADRQRSYPHGLSASSTHDTKRARTCGPGSMSCRRFPRNGAGGSHSGRS